jgi:hypothetical protein
VKSTARSHLFELFAAALVDKVDILGARDLRIYLPISSFISCCALFETVIDGKPRSYRDRKGIESAEFLKN